MQVSVSRRIAAPPARVWELVADVTRIGEFSPETFEAEWLDGADGPELGARFRGHVRRNEVGPVYWSTCRVSELEPGRVFGFDVLGPGGQALTHWRYELAPDGDGTVLTESMHLHRQNPLLRAYDNTLGRLREGYNERNIATTLARIAAVLEGTEPPARSARTGRTMRVSDERVVAASPAEVWAVVADPSRTPEYSPENVGAVTPHTGPLDVGDRFVGHNERGPVRWATDCEVVASEPHERFAFAVRSWGFGPVRVPVSIATWEYELVEVDGGTRVTETWRDDRRWPDPVADAYDKVATGGTTFAEFQRGNIRRSLDRLAGLFAG